MNEPPNTRAWVLAAVRISALATALWTVSAAAGAQCPDGSCRVPATWCAPPAAAPASAGALQPIPRAAERLRLAALVRVINTRAAAQSVGSGAIVDCEVERFDAWSDHAEYAPVVVTCFHLFAEGLGRVTVEFHDGRRVPAQMIDWDRSNDLAFLRCEVPDGITPLRLRRWEAALGERIESFGTGPSGQVRIVNAPVLEVGPSVLVCAGAMRPGDSGGPVLALDDQLVGVIRATADDGSARWQAVCCRPIHDGLARIRQRIAARRRAREAAAEAARPRAAAPATPRPPLRQPPVVDGQIESPAGVESIEPIDAPATARPADRSTEPPPERATAPLPAETERAEGEHEAERPAARGVESVGPITWAIRWVRGEWSLGSILGVVVGSMLLGGGIKGYLARRATERIVDRLETKLLARLAARDGKIAAILKRMRGRLERDPTDDAADDAADDGPEDGAEEPSEPGTSAAAPAKPQTVVLDTPPPPQRVERRQTFVPYESPSKRLAAIDQAQAEYVRKYPQAASIFETIEVYADQFESAMRD